MLELTQAFVDVVHLHERLTVVTWANSYYHILKIAMPPKALCDAVVRPAFVDYSRRPQGAKAKTPYLCAKCHLLFMRAACGGTDCPRGHGPMFLDTSADEFVCVNCGERRYPSTKGTWDYAHQLEKRKRGRPPWKKHKAVGGPDIQQRLF